MDTYYVAINAHFYVLLRLTNDKWCSNPTSVFLRLFFSDHCPYKIETQSRLFIFIDLSISSLGNVGDCQVVYIYKVKVKLTAVLFDIFNLINSPFLNRRSIGKVTKHNCTVYTSVIFFSFTYIFLSFYPKGKWSFEYKKSSTSSCVFMVPRKLGCLWSLAINNQDKINS